MMTENQLPAGALGQNAPAAGGANVVRLGDANMPIDEWILMRVGTLPKNSIGWFRCGVGFYNKKEFARSIECFQKAVELDPLNYNAYQIMSRACIAMNRKQEAIAALKQSVNLDNPSDWQLLVELTATAEHSSS